MKYRKKPVVIDAIQWKGNNSLEIIDEFPDIDATFPISPGPAIITTLEGDMMCKVKDFIIRGVKGEYYPCKPDVFEQTYERA